MSKESASKKQRRGKERCEGGAMASFREQDAYVLLFEKALLGHGSKDVLKLLQPPFVLPL